MVNCSAACRCGPGCARGRCSCCCHHVLRASILEVMPCGVTRCGVTPRGRVRTLSAARQAPSTRQDRRRKFGDRKSVVEGKSDELRCGSSRKEKEARRLVDNTEEMNNWCGATLSDDDDADSRPE